MLVGLIGVSVARRSSTPLYDDLKRQVRAYFTDEGIAAGTQLILLLALGAWPALENGGG